MACLQGAELKAEGQVGAEQVVAVGVQVDLGRGRQAHVRVDLLLEGEGQTGVVSAGGRHVELGLDAGVGVEVVGGAHADGGLAGVLAGEADGGGEGKVRVVLVEARELELLEQLGGAERDGGVARGVADGGLGLGVLPGVVEVALVGAADDDVVDGRNTQVEGGGRRAHGGNGQASAELLVLMAHVDLGLLLALAVVSEQVKGQQHDAQAEGGVVHDASQVDVRGQLAVVADRELLHLKARAVLELGADVACNGLLALGLDVRGVLDAIGRLGRDRDGRVRVEPLA